MRTALLAVVLVLVGCSNKPRYQGDLVLGGFNFTANLVSDTCSDGGSSDFQFSGVLSLDTDAGKLFLDTDGVNEDDHVGTLSGGHFQLVGEADRDFVCGPVHIVETLEGELFGSVPEGGCDGGADADSDGGAVVDSDAGVEDLDGGPPVTQPLLVCGGLRDDAKPLPTSTDGGCGVCEIVFRLSGTRQ